MCHSRQEWRVVRKIEEFDVCAREAGARGEEGGVGRCVFVKGLVVVCLFRSRQEWRVSPETEEEESPDRSDRVQRLPLELHHLRHLPHTRS